MTIGDKTVSIHDIMRPAVIVHENDRLVDILEKMIGEKRNSLVVVDDGGKLVGMIGAIDLIKAVLPEYIEDDVIAAHFADQTLLGEDAQRAQNTPAREFMTKDAPTIKETSSVLEAAANAIQSGHGRITVVDDEHKPVGIITRTEIKQVIGSLLGVKGAFE